MKPRLRFFRNLTILNRWCTTLLRTLDYLANADQANAYLWLTLGPTATGTCRDEQDRHERKCLRIPTLAPRNLSAILLRSLKGKDFYAHAAMLVKPEGGMAADGGYDDGEQIWRSSAGRQALQNPRARAG